MQERKMKKKLTSYRISPTPATKKLSAFLSDLGVVIATFIALFFSILYGISGPFLNYNSNVDYINKIENEYSLNVASGKDYKEYEKIVKDFYFVHFPEEVKSFYVEFYNYSEDYSLMRIYNIQVLSLPLDISSDNYSNNLFTYVQNNEGYYDYNIEGRIVDNNGGDYFYRSLADHFYNKVGTLKSLISYFDNNYNKAVSDKLVSESMVRTISFALSVIIYFLIIPLFSKNKQTIFERVFKVVSINRNDGLLIRTYKVFLRPLTYFLVPFIFVLFASNHALYALGAFYLFISSLISLINENHYDLSDLILKTATIDLRDSLVFRTIEEADKYYSSDEYEEIEDQEFLDKLSSIQSINIPSHGDDKNIKNKGDK